ncbi:MAG: PAS domain-containing protein [Chloroflexota bacterium]
MKRGEADEGAGREALAEMWRKYEFIVNTSQEFMTLINRDYVYEAVNESYCRAHGRPREVIVGRTVAEVWGETAFNHIIKQHLVRCFAGELVNYQAQFPFAALGPRFFDVTCYPYLNAEGQVTQVVVVSRDVTERKLAEEERARLLAAERQRRQEAEVLRERAQWLSRRLVEVQEAERRYVARELHDEIGQLLTGLKLLLEMNARSTTPVSLEEATVLVNELIARVRELSLDLRPSILDDLGLAPALLWHIERYMTQTQVQVAFRHYGLEGRRFAPEVELAVFRIAQEALTNVARHARASAAEAQVWVAGDWLYLQVKDNGVGFDADAPVTHSSGLAGMFERAALLGGRLTIDSTPGSGTLLTAELPLAMRVEG